MRETFEAEIASNPDDLDNYRVYADWLVEQGDPAGEFIQLQIQLEDPALDPDRRAELSKAERALLERNGERWLGSLAEFRTIGTQPGLDFSFARGFLDNLVCNYLTVNLARAIARDGNTRLLRRLEITASSWDDDDYEPGDDVPPQDDPREINQFSVFALAKHRYLHNLKILSIGEECALDGEYFYCSESGEGVAEFVEQLPSLEQLYLYCHNVDSEHLLSLELRRLRVLHLFHGYEYFLKVLADNSSVRNLSQLAVHQHAVEFGDEPTVDLESLRALAASPYLNSLTHLHLHVTDMGDESADLIVRSGLLKRLRVLDLRNGSMTDRGAEILAASADIGGLHYLDLSRNALSQRGIEQLRLAGVNVRADRQHQGDDEREWLYEGDIE